MACERLLHRAPADMPLAPLALEPQRPDQSIHDQPDDRQKRQGEQPRDCRGRRPPLQDDDDAHDRHPHDQATPDDQLDPHDPGV